MRLLVHQHGLPHQINALAAGAAPAEAHRGLGLCYLRVGQADRGKAAIGRYLQIKPDAGDRAMMTMLAGA
jgi:hypothetical protein